MGQGYYRLARTRQRRLGVTGIVALGRNGHGGAEIPLRDTDPSARSRVVNYAIIALNVAAFFYEMSLGDRVEGFILAHGLVPRHFDLTDLMTSMFLHGGLGHLFGNMLFLYIFGDNVEDRLGHGRYAVFYLLSGMAAGVA